MTMSERTIARCEPDITDGIVVNIEVVASDWVNDDPTHLIEYTYENAAIIGCKVVDGVFERPVITEDPLIEV